ncbi:MAG: zf-HC2 domain-containing protein, partial [Gemmatimonadales bacterium]
MSHLDEGTFHALLDGEISSADLPAVEQHLANCRECQARLAEARAFRDEAFGLIESLDESELEASHAASAGPAMMFDAAPADFALAEAAPLYPARVAKQAQSGPTGTDGRIRTRAPRWARPLAWAATIVVAVGLGYSWRGRVAPDQAESSVAAGQPEMDTRELAVRADSAPQDADAVAEAPSAALRATSPARETAPAAPEARAVPRTQADQPRTTAAQAAARDAAKAAPAPPPPRASESPALNRMAAARKRSEDTARLLPIERPIALSEVVTTGFSPRTPVISADSAIRVLGGSIRLVEGWNPDRYELVDSTVRVVYQ